MRKLKIKIDPLLLVLAASIVCLFSFSNSIKTHLTGHKSVLKKFENLSDIAHLPDSVDDSIYLYDPQFNIFYSVDGGDTYLKENQILASGIVWRNLSQYLISFRSKPVFGKQPILPSVLVKSQHKTKGVYTMPQMVTIPGQHSHQLPIVSLISSENGLFSEVDGIMTIGMVSWVNKRYFVPFWHQKANYKKRGGDSKKKCNWQLIENNKVVFESESDMQISGNATRSFPQKSMKLKCNKLYGDEFFRYEFFGKKGIKSYTSLVIRNSGNDNSKTLFADLLMHRLAYKTNVLTQQGKPIVLYINGNYWGIYNLRERIDEHMIAKKENVSFEDITILEGNSKTAEGNAVPESKPFIKLISKLDADHFEESYRLLAKEVDINSFIDYIILETFYGNGDWLPNNALWYKAKGRKWKWVLNDLDYGLTYQVERNLFRNYFTYLAQNTTENAKLFNFLIGSKDFKVLFKNRAREIIETSFSDKNIKKITGKLSDSIASEIENHINRWTSVFTIEEWTNNVKANESFLVNRKAIYLKQIENL